VKKQCLSSTVFLTVCLALCQARAAGPVAPASRQVVIEKRYLNLPVKNGGQMGRMSVSVDGRKVRVFDIQLTDGPPDFWAFIDAGAWQGKTATIAIDKLPGGSHGLEAIDQSDQIKQSDTLYKEKLRPQFHFSPKRGWTNDPNGMVYHDGQWHLFFQHNPYGWGWGNMHWGHAVSKDLVHWEELPIALYPWTMAKDHCFSGSATIDADNTSGFQTGGEKVMVAAFTDTGCGEAIAYSNDAGLTWTYWKNNPVVRHNGRDPYIFWYAPGRHWVMALYDGADGDHLAIYTSNDLKQWKFESKLPGYYECTNLFELPLDGNKNDTRWVAFGGNAEYAVGRFDGRQFTPEQQGKRQVHYGNFYASQVFNNAPDGRKIQIGWARIDMPGMPFNQMMSVPYELSLRTTGDGIRMFAQPVAELKKLRSKGITKEKSTIEPGKPLEVSVGSQLLDVSVTFAVDKAKGFSIVIFGREVRYDAVAKTLDSVPLQPIDGKLRLRFLVDRSSLEICGNDGRIAITRPFAPVEKDFTLQCKADGDTVWLDHLEVYELKSIWE